MPYTPPTQYNPNQAGPAQYNNFTPPPNATYQPPVSDNNYQAYNQNPHGGVTQATQNQWYPAPTGHDPPSNYPGNDPNYRSVSEQRDLGSGSGSSSHHQNVFPNTMADIL